MKKRFLGLLLGVMLISVCVGCGAESATTGATETVETTATTQESAIEQTEEVTETPAESTEQTTETTEKASEEVTTETETTEATPEPTVEPEPTEEPTLEPQVTYTYTDMSATMYATQTVNVRNQPSTDGEKIGSLSMNQEVQVISRCNETGWYKFIWTDGREAFVSNKYLSDSKVEVQKPAENNGSSSGGSTASNYPNPYDYPEGIWVDVGEWAFNVNSYEWGNNIGNYNDIKATLEARFPGEEISIGAGFLLNDGSGRYCWICDREGTYLIPFTSTYMAK